MVWSALIPEFLVIDFHISNWSMPFFWSKKQRNWKDEESKSDGCYINISGENGTFQFSGNFGSLQKNHFLRVCTCDIKGNNSLGYWFGLFNSNEGTGQAYVDLV